jgi:hypothetical protein
MRRHMSSVTFALVLPLTTVLALAVFAPRAAAITGGRVDYGNLYPNVGCLVVEPPDGSGPIFFMSGTLVTPRLFLTCGHGTRRVEEQTAMDPNNLSYLHVSFAPYAFNPSDPTTWRGVAGVVTHPSFRGDTGELRTTPCDVGLLILEEPFGNEVPVTPLPPLGYLGELERERVLHAGVPFRVVGYGSALEWPPPVTVPGDGWRRFADSGFLNVLQDWLLLHQNLASGDDGGTGYGDSGGPVFWTAADGTEVLVAETSWGDLNCVAMNFYQRLDIPEVQDFIYDAIAGLN